MAERKAAADDLLNVQDIVKEWGIAESTAWALIKRSNLPRYRLPGRGKTVFFRRSDVEDAYNTPVQVGGEIKKVEPLAA